MLPLFFADVAEAATYNVQFCVEWDVDFEDAYEAPGADDYYYANTPEPARGARVRVVRTSDAEIIWDDFEWDNEEIPHGVWR